MNWRKKTLAQGLAGSAAVIALSLFVAMRPGVAIADERTTVPAKAAVIDSSKPVESPAITTTQPATQPARIALPAEFAIFQTRNAFMRGKGPGAAPPGGPEANFVLRGVAQMGDKLIAFVEDKAAKHVTELSSGQPIGRGKVASINLDGIEYQLAGPAKSIKVGQDFNGQVVPPTPTSKPVAPGPQPGQEMPPGQEVQPGVPNDMPPGGPPRGARPRSAKVPG